MDIYEGAMEKWLKESWFKVGVLFVVILSGLFVVYYFVVFLPKIQNYEMQQKCDKSAQEFFKDQNFSVIYGDSAQYECHFNKKLNKCFIKMDVINTPSKAIAHSVVDVLENKDYGQCLEINYKATMCWMTGQKNISSYYKWDDASKTFMNE